MKQILVTLAVILVACFFSQVSFGQNTEENYTVSTDDTIQITIFDEPDLSLASVRIGASGTISMPLIGQITVLGLSISDIEALLISEYLDGFLKKPKISVTILEYRPFYINGEVENPGSYSYRRGLTIEKAVTLAGGFTKRASRSKIELVRETDKNSVINVDLRERVKPGDVITVNESFF